MVNRRRPHSRRRRGRMEFLWPFLLMILGGLILILLAQLVLSFLDQRNTQLKNQVYLYVDEGNAQIFAWGDSQWARAYHGQLVLEGDRVAMQPSSRGFFEFYNDSRVRFDEGTDVAINRIETEGEEDEIGLELRNGRVWVNVQPGSYDALKFVVETDHLRVTSFGTIFEVGMSDMETVRVLEDEVFVEVLDRSGDKEVVLDQVTVGVGQQIRLTTSTLEKMMSYQPVSLLAALDDEWKETEWYDWNREEDLNPTLFAEEDMEAQSELEQTDAATLEGETELAAVEDVSEETPDDEEVDQTESLAIAITFPTTSPYTLSEGETSLSIQGSASQSVQSVTVTSYDESGTAEPYTLKQYEPGDSSWSYNAALAYGNLREGRNRFTVLAFAEDGSQSDPLEVIVEVPEQPEEEDDSEVEEETQEEEPGVEEESSDSEEENPVSDVPLATPTVTSLNGDSLPAGGRYETSAESVVVKGTVSESAVAVYVNGFQLTQYVPGSEAWGYNVQPDFQNYDIGANTYTVVAENAAGETTSFTFEIFRVAP